MAGREEDGKRDGGEGKGGRVLARSLKEEGRKKGSRNIPIKKEKNK